jgi:hypothetical protein
MTINRIPLVVGVTGHRDLRAEDIPLLEAKVREILTGLQTRYPQTPLTVLTSLAEGADRLAARVALELKAPIVVPLPMPAEEYRKDFSTGVSQEEFARLSAAATATLVLPYASETDSQTIGRQENRNQQYLKAGLYVLRHCHILLALWDGDKTEKSGGTSQMVNYKLTGFPTAEMLEWAILNPTDAGIVFQVVTPRASRPVPADAFRVLKHYVNPRFAEEREEDGETTETKAEKVFFSLLERTNAFNRDLAGFAREIGERLKKSRAILEPENGPEHLDENLKVLLDRYTAADLLATIFQRWRHSTLKWLCLLIIPATYCMASYHAADRARPREMLACIGGFWVFVALAGILHFVAKIGAFEAKHLDYRALAEGLKILFFWRVAGIHDDVGAQYLRKQRSELDWIRLAVRADDLLTSLPTGPAMPYSWIKIHWMEQQRKYFEESAAQNERQALIFEWTSRILIAAGLLLAFVMVVVHGWDYWKDVAPSTGTTNRFHIFSVMIVVALTAAGSSAAYAEKLAFTQQSKQYSQMRRLFQLALREFDACLEKGEMNHLRSIIRRLGHEALRENGDWVLLHRERPMEVRLG